MKQYSPMMQHYLEIKQQYKDCVLFYRLGDFYEMFFDDALEVSKALELTLTGRECGMDERAPMCGLPYHAADTYIARLIEKGYKVAICEQLEDAKDTNKMVKRDVVRVVTPGTLIETNLLNEKKNNYIMAIMKKGTYYGIAICDISTGDFMATQISYVNNFSKLLDEISRYNPAEIVVNDFLYETKQEIDIIKERFNIYISIIKQEFFTEELENIEEQYRVVGDNDSNIELKGKSLTIGAINGLIEYLRKTQKMSLEYINKITIYNIEKYMSLDINARRNLEIVEKMRDKSKKGTLLWVLDKTSTAMGGRNLRRWLNNPLIDEKEINNRLSSVKELKEDVIMRGELEENLKRVYDIERLVAKISYGNANGRDLISLKNSTKKLPEIKQLISKSNSEFLKQLHNELDVLQDIFEIIDNAIVEEPPVTVKEGGLIKIGFNEEIDRLKKISTEGKSWIVKLELEERERTGIKNLKVGFNKVFGYFIEVTKSYLNLVPERYIRKQTLANCERYITEDLKNLENDILGADVKLQEYEYQEFLKIREKVQEEVLRIQKSANVISILDTLNSFAIVAEDMNYNMPEVDNSGIIDIKGGRHPVIEKILGVGNFIENDTFMDKEKDRLSIITGPNMAGKSTYMRQVALITLMAQCGSFVPAFSAKIGIVDKIFTRVGASDDLGMGQSTFMVEMMEVANILKDATQNSLIILDEIGRGTSTYDGLSIAWAVAEYISDIEKCGAKTLFATHYHELTQLEEKMEGVKNYSIAVKEKGEDIIFLRKIIDGGTDESYGVHVAKIAGVPTDVTKRANQILRSLERKSIITGNIEKSKDDKKIVPGQLDLYNYKIAELAHEIDKIDVNNLTPVDALNIIVKMKEKIG
ncbi:MAG: DNA mismatch repair protein MutS [Clostridia bacterium]|nr:DNA mismatch repair protein MutS [Clostridia bacterium]